MLPLAKAPSGHLILPMSNFQDVKEKHEKDHRNDLLLPEPGELHLPVQQCNNKKDTEPPLAETEADLTEQ